MNDLVKIRRALISVSDKEGLGDLVGLLVKHGVEIISTGGSAAYLREAGFEITDIADVTGFAEMLDGRVKTLHPKIHGGILARRDKKTHIDALGRHGISEIDLVIVNLYPFEKVSGAGQDAQKCVENIDIGGPALLRSAAKNHDAVTVICDSEDYGALSDELCQNLGKTTHAFRARLAAIAFGRTAAYDAAIASWFSQEQNVAYPRRKIIATKRRELLRYGENPHQSAAFYRDSAAKVSLADIPQIQGKALSYNNLNDASAAIELIGEFPTDRASVVAIIKHTNPCGVGMDETLIGAYQKAFQADPISAFGGIIVTNGEIGVGEAKAITDIFTEIVIAPKISEEARTIFAQKPNLRLLQMGDLLAVLGDETLACPFHIRSVLGGVLVQQNDGKADDGKDDGAGGFETLSQRAPTVDELRDLTFAWRIVKHVKSNAIVCAKDGQSTGIGAGQMNRVESVRLATASPKVAGSVLASDAFFPFSDSIAAAAEKGITAIIQPGGARRDDEIIAKADEYGLAMLFTQKRHFRH